MQRVQVEEQTIYGVKMAANNALATHHKHGYPLTVHEANLYAQLFKEELERIHYLHYGIEFNQTS